MPLQLPHLSLAKTKTLCEMTIFIVQESLKPAASTTTGKIRFFSEESSGSVPSQLPTWIRCKETHLSCPTSVRTMLIQESPVHAPGPLVQPLPSNQRRTKRGDHHQRQRCPPSIVHKMKRKL
ncbi:unnamed protein product, partial [Musa acuminata subsp. burmannicoides]